MPITDNVFKNKFYIWCIFAVMSFAFLGMNYIQVSVSLYFGGLSDTRYSGYGLLKCLEGSVSISGYMVILLLITNVAVLITGAVGIMGNIAKANIIRIIMMVESIIYLFVTIAPYLNIKKVLKEFDPNLSKARIGVGCYLNIALAVIVAIYFFVNMCKQLKDE